METPSYFDIRDQADSLRTTVARSASAWPSLPAERPWLLFGSGASYHAATAAAALLNAVRPATAQAAPASDVWMNPEAWLARDAVAVGLSRTGTTTETVQALRVAAAGGATTAGVSLTGGTPMVTDVDHALLLDHVGERGRVMTRSYANLLLAARLALLGAAERAGTTGAAALAHALTAVPDAVAAAGPGHDEAARRLAARRPEHLVLLGSGPDLGICRQAALQAQETARVPVEAHAVLDYRHGPIAAMTADSLVVVLTSGRSLRADLVLADDVAVLGGTIAVVGPEGLVGGFPDHVERVATADGLHPWAGGHTALPFLQLLAYHLTTALGRDPESVTNLDRARDPHVDPHVLDAAMFGLAEAAGPVGADGR